MGMRKACEKGGQKPQGLNSTEANAASLICLRPASHGPPHSVAPTLRALVGVCGRGPLGSGDTVTGHHLTSNMTQVKLKPAGRVPGPHPGGCRRFTGLFVQPAPFCGCNLRVAS